MSAPFTVVDARFLRVLRGDPCLQVFQTATLRGLGTMLQGLSVLYKLLPGPRASFPAAKTSSSSGGEAE